MSISIAATYAVGTTVYFVQNYAIVEAVILAVNVHKTNSATAITYDVG